MTRLSAMIIAVSFFACMAVVALIMWLHPPRAVEKSAFCHISQGWADSTGDEAQRCIVWWDGKQLVEVR